ncbi:MAG: alternative ribosome rescue aminoacyl-tRNA hydrolase ArfB [Gammaproteobacteria bacterium]
MLRITHNLVIPPNEIILSPIRSQGAGGQNVNKVSSAIHLRFDIKSSSLPTEIKQRLLTTRDQRISRDGILVIKAQSHRTQEKNKADALQRLTIIIKNSMVTTRKRKATKPTYSSRQKRLDKKTRHSRLKASRRKAFE